jgi:hypothetical protein
MDNGKKQRRKQQTRPFPIEKETTKRRQYSDREVGITHPDLSSFIRLNDQGDIEIFAAPGVGIVISSRSKSISLFADDVKLFTKDDGLKWNTYMFNHSASTYIEPTLVKVSPKSIHSAVNGIHHFLQRLDEIEIEESELPVTINPDYGFGEKPQEIPSQKYTSEESYEGLSLEQIALIEAYSTDYPQKHIKYIIKLLKEGYDFQQAHQKALREIK